MEGSAIQPTVMLTSGFTARASRDAHDTIPHVDGASQVRCTGPFKGKQCGRLLAFVSGPKFNLEIKCPRCYFKNRYTRGNTSNDVPRKRPTPLALHD